MSEYERAGIPVFKPYKSEMELQVRTYGGFVVKSFPLVHDIACYGFCVVEPSMGSLIYASDTEYVKWRFKNANHILVEANYAKELLCDVDTESAKRDHVLTGHMEIETTCEFLKANNNPTLRNVVLCHLSRSNADAEQFKAKAQKVVNCPVYVADEGLEVDLDFPF